MLVTSDADLERATGTWREAHRERRRADGHRLIAGADSGRVVLAVRTHLHDNGSRLQLVQVDEREGHRRRLNTLNQRSDAFREARAPPVRIEMTNLRVQRQRPVC